jgi:HKD family nuclease
LDVDKDGDKKEDFKKAAKDKEENKVKESIFDLTNQWKAYKG